MSISLEQQDWFKQLIDLVIERHNAEAAQARAQEHAEEERGLGAVHSSLASCGAAFGLPSLDASLSEDGGFPQVKFLSHLKHQLDIILDVAVALQRPYEGDYARIALTMVTAAVLNEQDRADYLADRWREVMTGQYTAEDVAALLPDHYNAIGESLLSRALLQDDPLLSLPVNQGISYFDIYLSGRLAVDLYGDERLERHEIEQTHVLTKQDRIHFVEAIIALAWSNGLLEAEERNLIKKQIQMLGLTKKESRKLINLMITPSTPKEFTRGFSSSETGMFVMRQLIIASLIDGNQDAREQKFLLLTSKEFGMSNSDFNSLHDEMKRFVQGHADAIDQIKNYRRSRRPAMLS